MPPGGHIKSLFSAQFTALFKRDIIATYQQRKIFFFLRLLIPFVALFILYIVPFCKKSEPYSGIPKTFSLNQLAIPPCFAVASEDDRVGLGAILPNIKCKAITYSPVNEFTTEIMRSVAEASYLLWEDVEGLPELYELYTRNLTTFFHVNFSSPALDAPVFNNNDFLANFSVLVTYNYTYADMPEYWHMYEKQQLNRDVYMDFMVLQIRGSSSLPMVLQAHVVDYILRKNGVERDFSFRSMPYKSNSNIPIAPMRTITTALFMVTIVSQFIFCAIYLQQDKTMGALDALRLAGVQDIVYYGEFYVYQMSIYGLALVLQLAIMYCLPGGNDIFAFTNPFPILCIMFVGGIYSTSLACLIASFSKPKTITGFIIVIFALMLGGLICFMFLGNTLLYDPSIMPTGFLRFLVRWLFPFAPILQNVDYELGGSEPDVFLNVTSLDYKLVPRQDYVSVADFFAGKDNVSCSFKKCNFDYPSESVTLLIPFFESFIFFFAAWLISEYVDLNASVCRPIWKVLAPSYFDYSDYSFTAANHEYEREQRLARRHGTTQGRKPLDLETAYLCLTDGAKRCDDRAKEQALEVLTYPSNGREALITHHLHKTFKRPHEKNQQKLQGKFHRAVRSVNIRVLKGEIFGIAGHNGAGKSTAISTISGSIKSDKPGFMLFPTPKEQRYYINNAWVDGKFSMRDDMNKIRRYLGYCPYFNTNVYQELTVRQNLYFICELQNVPHEDIDRLVTAALMQVGLLHVYNSLLSELSGGMYRRISIAMALTNPKKKLVILDEPSTGLDPQTKRVIWAAMKHTARNKRKCPVIVGSSSENQKIKLAYIEQPGVMITSHDMDELNIISDSITIMSDGYVVVTGTALELKRRFGKGWTLSVTCKSSEDSSEFVQAFIQHVCNMGLVYSRDPEDEDAHIRLVDQSGAVASFAISNQVHHQLDQIIKYVESLMAEERYLDDFCLETTSMDEVFVTVGRMYELANGGNNEEDVLIQRKPVQANSPVLAGDELSSQSEFKGIEFAEEEYTQNSLSDEEIQRILSPKRGKPSTFRAMLYKMMHNDKLNKAGFLSFLIIPAVCVLIAFLLSEMLVPWALEKGSSMMNWYNDLLDSVCSFCNIMKANGLKINECQGYTSFGYPNTCQYSVVLARKTYQPPIVWYGGDDDVFEPYSLYNEQQYPQSVYVFDDVGIGEIPGRIQVMSSDEAGSENIINAEISGFVLYKSEYYYYDSRGQISDLPRRAQYVELVKYHKYNTQSTGNLISQFPVKAVSYAKIDNDNNIYNQFTIARDLIFKDGYQEYEYTADVDSYLLNILRLGLKLEVPIKRSGYSCYKRNKCMFDDDYANIQHMQQEIAQRIPYGYIHFQQGDKVHITAFMPSRYTFTYSMDYGFSIRTLDSEKRQNFEYQIKQLLNDEDQVDDLLSMMFHHELYYQLSPSYSPTIYEINLFDCIYASGTTQIMDLMTRVSQGLLREHTGLPVNFRVGINIFKHENIDFMGSGGLAVGLMYSTVFLSVASLMGVSKYGFHIVQDRQTGMRKSLYLNGVTTAYYWGATVLYCLLVCLGLQIFILILGGGIFQISAYKRMDIAVLILHTLGGVFAVVSTSLLFSAFFTKTSMFSASAVIIILLSLIIVMMEPVAVKATPFAYVLPTLAYVSLFVYLSYNGTNMRYLVQQPYGVVYLWMIIESIIMILLAIYLDNVLPINGYCKQPWYWPFMFFYKYKEQDQINVVDKKFDNTVSSSKGRPIDDYPNKYAISISSQVELLDVPAEVKIETTRDYAAAHGEDRMDIDVRAERQLVKCGVAADTPIIVSNLQKRFGGFLALRDMTFHVPNIDGRGCIFALLGPNGAAKTTTINMMTGLLEPTRGGVFLHQRNMADRAQAVEVYRNLGLCSQFDIYLPDLSVRQHLVLFAALHGVAWADIDNVVQNLARFVCLENVLEKRVGQLSGGMKRRMSLALALIG